MLALRHVGRDLVAFNINFMGGGADKGRRSVLVACIDTSAGETSISHRRRSAGTSTGGQRVSGLDSYFESAASRCLVNTHAQSAARHPPCLILSSE